MNPKHIKIALDRNASAHRLTPEDWNLTLHRDPSDRYWMVSDILTGRMIGCGLDMDRAIHRANRRLSSAAKLRGLTIPQLLDNARQIIQNEAESV